MRDSLLIKCLTIMRNDRQSSKVLSNALNPKVLIARRQATNSKHNLILDTGPEFHTKEHSKHVKHLFFMFDLMIKATCVVLCLVILFSTLSFLITRCVQQPMARGESRVNSNEESYDDNPGMVRPSNGRRVPKLIKK